VTSGSTSPTFPRPRQAAGQFQHRLPPSADDAGLVPRREDITQAQYGAWMAEPHKCPACGSPNVAIEGDRFGGLWCLECRHEWRVTRFPSGVDPAWWRQRG
jgi:hypothetical protein